MTDGFLFFLLSRRSGRIGLNFGGSNGGSTKVILTLDDLIFINTQISKRVSCLLELWLYFLFLPFSALQVYDAQSFVEHDEFPHPLPVSV